MDLNTIHIIYLYMNGDDVSYINPNIPNTHHSILNLERAEKLKFAFSHDKYNATTKKIVKNFFNLEHFSDVEKLLKEDKHIYELAYNTTRKLYFDFDDLHKTTKEATDFINTLVERINNELKIIINPASVIVLKNDKYDKHGHPTDMIHSLHVIINDYKIDTSELYEFAKYMNHTYDMDIDVNVYKKNQQFRLWKQSKMTKKIRLVNFYDGCVFPLRKSFINITDKCKATTFNKCVNIADYYKTLDDDKKIIQLPKEKLFNLIVNGKVEITPYQTLGEIACEGLAQTEQITFDRDDFFNDKNANDWKTITMLLKKYPHLYSLESWNKESVRLSNNPNYTYEANAEYCSKIVIEDVRSGYTKLFKLISKYCVYHNIYDAMDYMKDHVRDLLGRYYDMATIREIAEKIVKFQTIKSKPTAFKKNTKHIYNTLDDTNSVIDVKSGFIYIKNDTNTILNMFYDNLPAKHESMFHQINHIDEAVEETKAFLSNRKKIMTLLSRWGTGKTFKVINTLIKDYKPIHTRPIRRLVITESNGLNNKLNHDFNSGVFADYNFVSHLDAQADITIDLKRCNNVICSIQSIGKVGNDYDLIIIDEFESVCSSYSATTTFKGTTPNIAFNTLIHLIKTSDKTLLCDADISEDKVELIERVVGRNEMIILKNNQSAFDGLDINILTNKQHFTTLLLTKVFIENKKIAVASATRVYVEAVFDEIVDLYSKDDTTPIKRIMRVDVNGVKVYHGATEVKIDKTKNEILKDVEAFIIEQQIDLFLYSPTIKTGLSINSAYFHQTFGYTSSVSILFNEMIQMLFRNRKVIDNKIILFIDERDFKCGVNKTHDFIEKQQHINTALFKQLISKKQSDMDNVKIYTDKESSAEYYQLQTINNRNKYNSHYNYVSNFIQLLQYHNLNYKYITNKTYEIVKSEYDINIIEALETLKEKKQQDWIETKLLDYKDFIDRKSRPPLTKYLLNDKDQAKQTYSEEIKNSYIKTSSVYFLLKVDNIVLEYKDKIETRNTYTPFQSLRTDEQIQTIIDTHISGYNNDLFYVKYIKDNLKNNVGEIFKLFKDKKANLTNTDTDKMMIDILMAEELIEMFDIYNIETRIFKPRTITNKDFNVLLTNNIKLIQRVYDKAIGKTGVVFNVKNKQHTKAIYHSIKQFLSIIDIGINYVDENTTRPTDKMTIYTTNHFYKYNTDPVCSTTLDHLTDQSKPQTLTINKEDVYSEKELNKILKRKKQSKTELIKIQKSLLYYETDLKYEIICDDDDNFLVNITNEDTKTHYLNDTFYNPLLNIKTIDDKSVMICDKQYPIIVKKNGRLCIVMNSNTGKQSTLYKNDDGNYRPYNATIPTIKTEPNDNYTTPSNSYYTAKKNTYETSGEECCECDYDDYGDELYEIAINDIATAEPKSNVIINEIEAESQYENNEDCSIIKHLHINEPLINEIKNQAIVIVC